MRDDLILWGAKLESLKIADAQVNLGKATLLTYEALPSHNYIYQQTLEAYNQTKQVIS